ncbi:ABC transporter substrate-binding protein [Mesorhizobium sp. RSR565B]|uniref:ABC transporter substrate-binding protein n=1 Tax=Mesorhizobium sp. L103C565B0 TaxID=1287094 RepID=UPI0009DE900D|nr:ABC transporter substrate-binding protein [Mesorhizobium sp. L103C565B0]
MQTIQTRRRFLAGAAMVGAAGIVGLPESLHAEPPLETTTVRLPWWVDTSYCWAGAYIAGELMRAEGFTDVRYVKGDKSIDQSEWIARGETDFSVNFPPNQITSIDAGVPIKVLTGLHSGCLELIARENIRSVTELRGKRVGVDGFNSSRHVWLTLMAAYVGLDPVNDIQWVLTEGVKPTELFVQGKIDAFLGTPPQPQELRAQKIGHTILNNAVDRPWSQYFCCMISATTDYVTRYPVATKRVLRSILKAADLCASDPQMVARLMVDREFMPSYDNALQTLKDIRYDRWRDFDPEDSMRFYALRMQETGMIKAGPQQIIADGTDWRFLDELKRELKT